MAIASALTVAPARHATRWRWCLGGLLLAGVLCIAVPGIDLGISHAVYTERAGFVGQDVAWVEWLRNGLIAFYFICLAVSFAGWIAALSTKGTWLGADVRKWFFLVLCLGLGPGMVANIVFKEQWGRARPKSVVEFGGSKQFTRALLPSTQCKRGCSFVSGEASSVFVPFYAAAAIMPQWAAPLLVAGTVGGFITGALRISQGAHFLSDIVFAGLFMALLVLALSRLMRPSSEPRASPTAPATV